MKINKNELKKNSVKGYEDRGDNFLNQSLEFMANIANAEQQGEMVIFVDETGIRSDSRPKRLWSDAGNRSEINYRILRFKLSIIAASTRDGFLAFKIFDGPVNASSFGGFLLQMFELIQKSINPQTKPLLIMDNATIHKATVIKKLQSAYKFVFLPAYSPNLNHVEYLFAPFKHFVTEEIHRSETFPTIKVILEAVIKTCKYCSERARIRFLNSVLEILEQIKVN